MDESKWIRAGVPSTKSGSELEIRLIPVFGEIGILDRGQDVSIYWPIAGTDKLIEKLKEVMK